jgi:hypothetical protein
MFDTISGLPVHVLVVHAVVVLLPLMSIVTAAVAVRRSWRHYAPAVVVVDAVVLVLAFAAKESGERLQGRLQQLGNPAVAQDHGEKGALVPYVALGVLVAAVLVWLTTRSARFVPVAVVVSLVAGAVGIGWTYVTGESGARAVWGEVVSNTKAPAGG